MDKLIDTIKIVGLNGSPRKEGNSETLLKLTLDYLANSKKDCEIEQINLVDYNIKSCKACGICGKTKDSGEFIPCVQEKDDDAVKLWEKIFEAEGLIIATPVYFGLPTPLLIEFLNRSRYLRHQDFRLTNKIFGVMAIAGRRSGGNETTIFSTWYPLIRNGMIPVGNGDKSCQFGVVGWAGGKKEILKDKWAIIQAKDLADRIYDTAKIIKAGSKVLGWKNPLKFDYPSATIREWHNWHNLDFD